MRILPVTCFALAAAVAVSMLPASSSYARTCFNKAPICGSTGQLSTEGVGDVEHFKAEGGDRDDDTHPSKEQEFRSIGDHDDRTFPSKEQEFGSIGDRTRSSRDQDARSNGRSRSGR